MAKGNGPARRRALAARACIAVIAAAAWTTVPAASAAAATGRAAAAAGDCSVATARSLVEQGMPGYIQAPLDRVYCGAFLGPASEAMVVIFAPQCGCGAIHFGGWDVFRLVNGVWTLGSEGVHGLPVFSITVKGMRVTEERAIRRRDDLSLGLPTGGRQARTWSWDGIAGMAATPWNQVVPAEALEVVAHMPRDPKVPADITFGVAGRLVACRLQDARAIEVRCTAVTRRLQVARLDARGGVQICRITPRHACAGTLPTRGLATLHTGKTVLLGRFRCTSGRAGLRCTISGSGRGFVIDRGGVHRIRR